MSLNKFDSFSADYDMNIRLHIERLILDGISIPSHQVPQLQTAVETELARLLAERGVASELTLGGALAQAPAGMMRMSSNHEPEHLGRQIAQAVYGGIGK